MDTKHTILIVDDSEAVHQAIKRTLARQNYDLLFAFNGQEGLSLFRKYKPSVTLLDLRMPFMDGIAFLEHVDIGIEKGQAVIVLTGHEHDEEIQQCFRLGVQHFLQKPFNIYHLRGTIRSLTDQIDNIEQLRQQQIELQTKQMEHAYQISLNEISNDLIHDIGNAVSPLVFSLGTFKKRIQLLKDTRIELETISDATALQKNDAVLTNTKQNLDKLEQYLDRLHTIIETSSEYSLSIIRSNRNYQSHNLGETTAFSLPKTVQDILIFMQPIFEKQNITIQFHCDPTIDQIHIPRTSFIQLVNNLLKNAVEALSTQDNEMENEMKQPTIALSIQTYDKTHFSIEITDNGCGISKENQAHIFEYRFSTKERSSGYGLHSAQNFVSYINGSITVKSDGIGKGTTFSILLPYQGVSPIG